METRYWFWRAFLGLPFVALLFFAGEFYWEWSYLGRPNLFADASWAGENNAKLVDVLSPMARAYNNILAMLLATIGLAIPLTAAMHTPKLIEMFLRDRINQFMLGFCAAGAAHVLWVDYLIGPRYAPMGAYRLAVAGALLGWIGLIPYFFYVVRFLDPSNILSRLQYDIIREMERARTGKAEMLAAHVLIEERLHHIGTLLIKAIDRADRGVVLEGIWSMKRLLDQYGQRKPAMPEAWFRVQRKDLIGMSAEAIAIVNQNRTWFEHHVLSQLALAYQSALAKAQDVISALSDAARSIALHAAQRGDTQALDLSVKFFNNFLREAVKRQDLHAIYDLLYQYRVLAGDLLDRPQAVREISLRMRTYSEAALGHGLSFVPQMAGCDLSWIIRRAYQAGCPAAPEVLTQLLAMKHRIGNDFLLLLIKAKAILGSSLLEQGLEAEAEQVRANLLDVPEALLVCAENDLLSLTEPTFWEVTDRQVNFEWVPPESRPFLKRFFDSLKSVAGETKG